MKTFPDGFLWGASTAAYQVEGGIDNTDWAAAGRAGRTPVAGRACDHYHRYEEDFDIARSLGHTCHRFSIEWARIEPEEGKFDEAEIEHYRRVLRALQARGLTPLVNVWHFTLPLWFSERGGFLHADAPEAFARYAARVIERLGGEAEFWLTENEPLVYAGGGYLRGVWPPFIKRSPFKFLRVCDALVETHKRAYTAMKKVRPEIHIGIAKHNIFFEANANPLNMLMCAFADWFWNHRFLRRIKGYQDFIGLNHYHHRKFGATVKEKAAVVRSDMGWEVHPTSLYHCLVALKRYDLPIYVSENGIADAADTRRAKFITDAAACVHRAIAEGVPVKGYLYWSLLDNFEWAEGFTKHFGLVEVEYGTFARKVRPSAYVYKRGCEENALID